jgi:hypothetical protein
METHYTLIDHSQTNPQGGAHSASWRLERVSKNLLKYIFMYTVDATQYTYPFIVNHILINIKKPKHNGFKKSLYPISI